MAFRFTPGRSIDAEARRIADTQLQLAIAGMDAIGDQKSDDGIHQARRNVKRVRALLRLLEPSFGRFYRAENKRLRQVSCLLAPIADSEAAVDTLERLGKRFRSELPRRTLSSMRKALVRRWARVDQLAIANHVLRTGTSLLRLEQRRVPGWRLKAQGFKAIADGLETTVRSARRAMARAIAHPTIGNYHAWRRRVKDHWLQVRLLEGRCGGALVGYERVFEALDRCLGEYHNCALLQASLLDDAPIPRDDVARTLRLLRLDERELRGEAVCLARQIYDERPRQFVKRVHRLWRSARNSERSSASRTSWPQAA